jgi:hypothetical protein
MLLILKTLIIASGARCCRDTAAEPLARPPLLWLLLALLMLPLLR